MKKFLLSLIFIISIAGASHAAVDVFASSPWIAVLVRFIGGINVNVTSLTSWDGEGRARAGKNTSLPNADIIALDRKEATKLGLDEKFFPNLQLLYEEAPFDTSDNNVFRYFTDPSVLPFIAQRVLPTIAHFDPDNFAFYQRRLSEFQTRFNSTILAGRHLLRGLRVLDLTGGSGYFLAAAGCDVAKISPQDFDSWTKWKNMDKLNEALLNNQRGGGVVIVDNFTPKSIRTVASSFPNNILTSFTRPNPDEDFLTMLHNQYMLIWEQAKDKIPK